MERKYINQSITVATSDITKLSNDICEALECGDIVRKVDSNCKKETYIVAKKESDKMSLVHTNTNKTFEVCYEKGANGWVYDETKESAEIPQDVLADIEKFLDGEMPNNNVLALIQQNGIVFDKQYIFVDDEVQIVDEIPEDYNGASIFFGSDGIIFSEVYQVGELVSSVELGPGDCIINDISFSQKATVWEVDDVEDLGSWLDENASKLKAGDIFIDQSDNIGIIYYKVDETIDIRCLLLDHIIEYEYLYSGNDGWSLDSSTETPLGGTKLYKHTVDIDGEDFTVICPESSQFNSSNVKPYYIGFNLSNNIHCHLVYSTDAFVLVDGAGSSIATASSITDTVVGL